jgi:FKBP-type peptidyl-prolyl cis-trans isomerase FklB
MKKLLKISLFSMLVFVAVTLFSCNAQAPKANLKNAIDSVSYAQGVLFSSQQIEQIFAQFNLDSVNKADFAKGFQEGFGIDPKDKKLNAYTIGKMMGHQMGTQFVPYFNHQLFGKDTTQTMSRKNFLSAYLSVLLGADSTLLIKKTEAEAYSRPTVERIKNETLEKLYSNEKKTNLDFLEQNKAKDSIITLPSGLQYKIITEGKGPKPVSTDMVKVDYRGTTIDGKVFDSSYENGAPATFRADQVIKGWTEGLQLMPTGSKFVLYIPYNLAYGEQGAGDKIPPFSTLVFEIELHEIVTK